MNKKMFYIASLIGVIFISSLTVAYAASDATEKEGCWCQMSIDRKSKNQFKITPGSDCDKDNECKKSCTGPCPKF